MSELGEIKKRILEQPFIIKGKDGEHRITCTETAELFRISDEARKDFPDTKNYVEYADFIINLESIDADYPLVGKWIREVCQWKTHWFGSGPPVGVKISKEGKRPAQMEYSETQK